MRTEIRYSITLKKDFDATDTSQLESLAIAGASKPISDFQTASGDYFMHVRMTPIETFVTRMARFAPEMDISSHRLLELSEEPSKALCIALGEKQFWVKNFVSGIELTASSAHIDNEAFLQNVRESVGAFSVALAAEKPELKSEISYELKLLENRLRQNCHDIIARMDRRDRVRAYKEARHARNNPPMRSATILPFKKPEIE